MIIRRGRGIPRLRDEAIPILSYGFRPFFLGAAVWACAAMALWIGLLSRTWTFRQFLRRDCVARA